MKILLIRLRLIGDVVFTTPAIGALRSHLRRHRLLLLALISQQVVYRLARDLFEHMQRLSLRFFEKWGTGEIISRIKILSKLDIAEKRLPQDGRIALKLGDKSAARRLARVEAPEEFLAVASEYHFSDPQLLRAEMPKVAAHLERFYGASPFAET